MSTLNLTVFLLCYVSFSSSDVDFPIFVKKSKRRERVQTSESSILAARVVRPLRPLFFKFLRWEMLCKVMQSQKKSVKLLRLHQPLDPLPVLHKSTTPAPPTRGLCTHKHTCTCIINMRMPVRLKVRLGLQSTQRLRLLHTLLSECGLVVGPLGFLLVSPSKSLQARTVPMAVCARASRL